MFNRRKQDMVQLAKDVTGLIDEAFGEEVEFCNLYAIKMKDGEVEAMICDGHDIHKDKLDLLVDKYIMLALAERSFTKARVEAAQNLKKAGRRDEVWKRFARRLNLEGYY